MIRYSCGNGDGMFDDTDGYWVSNDEAMKLAIRYGAFLIRCDRSGMPLLDLEGYVKLEEKNK